MASSWCGMYYLLLQWLPGSSDPTRLINISTRQTEAPAMRRGSRVVFVTWPTVTDWLGSPSNKVWGKVTLHSWTISNSGLFTLWNQNVCFNNVKWDKWFIHHVVAPSRFCLYLGCRKFPMNSVTFKFKTANSGLDLSNLSVIGIKSDRSFQETPKGWLENEQEIRRLSKKGCFFSTVMFSKSGDILIPFTTRIHYRPLNTKDVDGVVMQ